MMTAFGVFLWMKLSEKIQMMRRCNQLKKSYILTFKLLQKKERLREEALAFKDSIENKRLSFSRAAQDIMLKYYTSGLLLPKTLVSDPKVHGDPKAGSALKRLSARYSRSQVLRMRWLTFLNVPETEELITNADASVDNLEMIEAYPMFDSKTDGKVIPIYSKTTGS